MTAKELVKLPAKKIRNTEELMRLYIGYYEDAFSLQPNCAPCTFSKDLTKLKNFLLTGTRRKAENTNTMKNTEQKYVVKRKHRSQIFTYKKDGKPFRIYGHLMTDDFAKAFIKAAANKEEKAKREAMFEAQEPKKQKPAPKKINTSENKETVKTQTAQKEASEGKYTEKDIKYLKRPEVDQLLKDNQLNPEDYTKIDDAKEALLKL